MSNINMVVLTGNLTRDPELRTTASGMNVLQFSMAVNDRVKEGGEWKDRPNYIDCTMFGTRAESLSRFLHKGSKIAVQGKLHWSSWEKDNQKRSKIEVFPDSVELLTPRTSQPAHEPEQQQMTGMPEPSERSYSIYDDDMPF